MHQLQLPNSEGLPKILSSQKGNLSLLGVTRTKSGRSFRKVVIVIIIILINSNYFLFNSKKNQLDDGVFFA